MKRFIASFLAIVILCSNFCYAMPLLKKKETVYVNLENYGNVGEINIYSKCKTNDASEIKDYTNYVKVSNLTNRVIANQASGELIWNVSGEKDFSYTGKVSGEYFELLPWNFEITYKLNGVEVKPEELLGASGLVEIEVEVNSNENANEYYRNNYILEVTASYDMSEYLSAESDEAMITDTGNTKTLMFIVLPGQSTKFNIKLGSEDFKMDGITMAGVPLTGDILEEISDLVEDKKDIEDSVESIDKSTDIILDALSGMNSGLNGVSAGVSEIQKGTQELHGISELRDEDIANLKTILEELLPITQSIQTDLENINSSYETFIEMYENLDIEVKNLQENVSNLNEEFEKIVSMSKNLPSNVETIKDLISSLAKLTGDLGTLLNSLDDAETEKLVKENLETLGEEAQKLARLAGTVEDENVANSLASSANSIGVTAKSIKTIFENISLSQIKNKSTLSKDLTKLKNNLYELEEILDKDDAKTIKNFIASLKDTADTLEKMLDVVSKYNDEALSKKEDVSAMISNMKQLVDELSKMNVLSVNMVQNIQSMLKVLSNSLYNGTQKTTESIISINNQLAKITNQSSQFKSSKNQIKDVIDSKMDKLEEETTLFNIDKDAKVVSFGSEKNENVESVQFIFKTPDIKKTKEAEKDLEEGTENITFWDRLKLVFQKMFGWMKNIF